MSLSRDGLAQLLTANVVELRFVRRNPRAGRSVTRRMLATLNSSILDSDIGRQVLNFKSPSQTPAYNAGAYNLLVVYDMFMQDWRAVPADSAQVIQILPSNPPELFWTYFNEVLLPMTADQKATFMEK